MVTASMALMLRFAMTVSALSRPSIELQFDSCVQADLVEVGRVVAIELRVVIVPKGGETTTQVSVDCHGPFYQVRVDEPETQEVVVDAIIQRNYLELRVDDPVTGKTVKRLVDLSHESKPAQARLLGTAISELVRASWVELVVNPTPKVEPLDRVDAPAMQQAVVERARSTTTTSITPECGLTFYGKTGVGSILGCGVGVRSSGHLWHVSADARIASGDEAARFGSIDVAVASGRLAVGMHTTLSPFVLSVDVGGRVGRMTVSGNVDTPSPIVGNSSNDLWGGPSTSASIDVAIAYWISMGLAAEAGYALAGLRSKALTDTIVDTRGFWVTPAAHIVFNLP